MNEPIVTNTELVEWAQVMQAKHLLKAAEYTEQRSKSEAEAAAVNHEKAQVELRASELIYNRVKQANRPAIILGAIIQKETRAGKSVYVAKYAGLAAEGDSPEIAFNNFDHEWSQGEDRE